MDKEFLQTVRTLTTPANKNKTAVLKHFTGLTGQIAAIGGIGMWDWDLMTGSAVFSKHYQEILGFKEGSLKPEIDSWTKLVLPEDLEKAQNDIAEYLDSHDLKNFESYYFMRKKNGKAIAVFVRGCATEWDEFGRPMRLMGTMQDISAVKPAATGQADKGTKSTVTKKKDTEFAQIENQNKLLKQVAVVAAALAYAKPSEFDEVLKESLKTICLASGFNRAYICSSTEDGGGLLSTLISGWEENQSDKIGEFLAELDLPWHYLALLVKGKSINLTAAEAEPKLKQRLTKRGAKGILVLPMLNSGGFWGYAAFENTAAKQLLGDSEIKQLQSGCIVLVSAILRNLNTKNLLEAKQQAVKGSEAKSEFLSRVTHEIRTQMNAVIGMNTIAKKSDDMQKVRYCQEKISAASQQMVDVINDVLDVSKIEANKFEINYAEFDFEKMLQKVLSVVQIKISEKEQLFTVDMGEGFFNNIISDELRLSQVITNLLTNASKFTPHKGMLKLRVSHAPVSDERTCIEIEVSDNGIGIPQNHMDKLFDAFEQADKSIAVRYGGSGLGLAISKKIVNLLGSDIVVQSEDGKGSVFSFKFEADWGRRCAGAVRGEIDPETRVLLVDENKDICEYFKSVLSGYSLCCDSADCGETAIKMAKNAALQGKNYDIAFVDFNTPRHDGAQTIKELKRIANCVAVVMVAAESLDDIGKECGELDVVRFLPKPIRPSVLYNTIMELTQYSKVYQNKNVKSKPHLWEGKRVMIVEDIAINREILSNILEDTGVIIENAENGRIAVDNFRADPKKYDLIIMDVQMPVMDGFAATSEIRLTKEDWAKRVPIIAMTANAFKEDIEQCKKAGMNNHVAKPIDIPDFIEKISVYLD